MPVYSTIPHLWITALAIFSGRRPSIADERYPSSVIISERVGPVKKEITATIREIGAVCLKIKTGP